MTRESAALQMYQGPPQRTGFSGPTLETEPSGGQRKGQTEPFMMLGLGEFRPVRAQVYLLTLHIPTNMLF